MASTHQFAINMLDRPIHPAVLPEKLDGLVASLTVGVGLDGLEMLIKGPEGSITHHVS
jgi:hypothetical protein